MNTNEGGIHKLHGGKDYADRRHWHLFFVSFFSIFLDLFLKKKIVALLRQKKELKRKERTKKSEKIINAKFISVFVCFVSVFHFVKKVENC